jgi:L-alanine-DL-glutamate epimerase-like enolase superfamily enzyme
VWFEEPFEAGNIDAYVALKARTAVPPAAGENETSPRGLAELVRRRAMDIVQPDASRAGGISSVLQVRRRARPGRSLRFRLASRPPRRGRPRMTVIR